MIRLPPCFVHGAMILTTEQFLLIAQLDRVAGAKGWTFTGLRSKVGALLEEADGMDLTDRQVHEIALWCLYRWIEFEFVTLLKDGPVQADRRWAGDPDQIERYLEWEDTAKASARILDNLERLGHRRNRKEWLHMQTSDHPDTSFGKDRRRWADWTRRPIRKAKRPQG